MTAQLTARNREPRGVALRRGRTAGVFARPSVSRLSTRLPTPPSDDEKLRYLGSGQHRWLFVVSTLAFIGVAASLAGLASQSYWTAVFFVPLALLVVEQLCGLRTATFRRRLTLVEHQRLVT